MRDPHKEMVASLPRRRVGLARAARPVALAAMLSLGAPASANPPVVDPPIVVRAPNPAVYDYVVQRGDTLPAIARAYLGSPDDARAIQASNRIADPAHPVAGSHLAIPARLLRAETLYAYILSFRGSVVLNGQRVRHIGMIVGEGGRIETGLDASVSFSLTDGSSITLPSQSVVRVSRLRRILISGRVERAFLLDAGSGAVRVTPSRGRDPFEIRTPVSVAAVRGTEFRVAVNPGGGSATASVLKGVVDVAAGGEEADVPLGFGTRSGADATPKPVPLLPPPEFVGYVSFKKNGAQTIRLAGTPGAARYHMQIASDAEFLRIRNEFMQADTTFELPPVDPGTYYIRATAYDVHDIEGFPATRNFTYRKSGSP